MRSINQYNAYPEIKASSSSLRKLFLSISLNLFARAVQWSSRLDKIIKEIISTLPEDLHLILTVLPSGPEVILKKTKRSTLIIRKNKKTKESPEMHIKIRDPNTALRLLSFRESITLAANRNRFIIKGSLEDMTSLLKIFDRVTVYIIPGIISKKLVRRYPPWNELCWPSKIIKRLSIYLLCITGR